MKFCLFVGMAMMAGGLFLLGEPASADSCAKLLGKGDVYRECRARESGKPGDCASIQDSVARNTCLARNRSNPSQCASIPNNRLAEKVECEQRARGL